MMTSQASTESTRQILGKALLFIREHRRLSQQTVASRIGCSHSDIDNWEQGKAVPDDHHWERLNLVFPGDLGNLRAVWQRARREPPAPASAKVTITERLTTKPFANLPALVLVPSAPPKLVRQIVAAPPATPAAPTPETLHDDGFDLRPAYKAVNKLPEGWRTTEAVTERRRYATELIRLGWTNTDIYSDVKRKFHVGIEMTVLAKLRAEVREAKTREYQATRAQPAAQPIKTETPVTTPAPPAKPTPPPNDIEGAVRLILEAIPNLKSFKIEVGDDGEVSVDHTIREVKVVETSGSLRLKR